MTGSDRRSRDIEGVPSDRACATGSWCSRPLSYYSSSTVVYSSTSTMATGGDQRGFLGYAHAQREVGGFTPFFLFFPFSSIFNIFFFFIFFLSIFILFLFFLFFNNVPLKRCVHTGVTIMSNID